MNISKQRIQVTPVALEGIPSPYQEATERDHVTYMRIACMSQSNISIIVELLNLTVVSVRKVTTWITVNI